MGDCGVGVVGVAEADGVLVADFKGGGVGGAENPHIGFDCLFVFFDRFVVALECVEGGGAFGVHDDGAFVGFAPYGGESREEFFAFRQGFFVFPGFA